MFPANGNMKLVLVITILLVAAYEGEGFEANHYQQILESTGPRLQNRFFGPFRFIGDFFNSMLGGGNKSDESTKVYVLTNPTNTQDNHHEAGPWGGHDRGSGAGGSHDGRYGKGRGGRHDGGNGGRPFREHGNGPDRRQDGLIGGGPQGQPQPPQQQLPPVQG